MIPLRISTAPLVATLAVLARSLPGDEDRFAGTWKGDLAAGARVLPFAFHLRIDEAGNLAGALDSPSEDLYGLPIERVERAGDAGIALHLKIVNATYEATLVEGGKALEGKWKQRGAEIPLRCARSAPEKAERVPGQERLAGAWEGRLETQGAKLRIVFRLREEPSGRIVGTFDSPDQGAVDLPIGKVEFASDGAVTLRMGVAGASYLGKLDGGGAALRGAWKQGGATLPLALERVSRPSPTSRPQAPKPPFPYPDEEVKYRGAGAAFDLAGTLSIPAGDGPFPAAILISGSGPQDRDEAIFGHRPFAVLADALARRGIAVLRSDDRGVGGSGGDLSTATTLDLATDVEAAIEFLGTRKEIDRRRVGLLGHSEGGLIAPLLAARRGDVAFVVLLAGPGLPGEQILYRQAALLARAAGASEEAIAANRRQQERIFAILKDARLAPEEAALGLREVLRESPGGLEGKEAEDLFAAEASRTNSPWLRFFLSHDPAPALEKVRCPVLALFGEKDLQVPAEENAAAVRAALEKGKNQDATVLVLPGLNHLFQPCRTGAVGEYGELETTFDGAALARVVEWVEKRFVPGPR